MILGNFADRALSADHLRPEDFSEFENRKLRYGILWSMYENTAYSNVHQWAISMRTRLALYQYVRSIYSPAYRLAEFYKSHLWGGSLDPKAGDGSEVPSAIPIDTGRAGLRRAIAEVWKWSNWSLQKDVVALRGCALGDTFLRVMISPEYERVFIETIDPSAIKEVEVDAWDNIKAYKIEYQTTRPDTDRTAMYLEVCERDGDAIIWRTYMDGAPFDWGNGASEWSEDYGFVPMVHIKHSDVGIGWGLSEIHPALSRIREVDDLASMLTDELRKIIQDTGFLMVGVKKPATVLTPSTYDSRRSTEDTDVGTPAIGREEIPHYYVNSKDANAIPMTLPLDVPGIIQHIQGILTSLERDYPELSFDNLRLSGTVSGASLRTARQPAESKVLERRANYDAGLVKIQQMAVSIGAYHEFPGFGDFTLNSYDSGALDHQIGERPIFRSGEFEDLEEEEVFWRVAKAARDAGVPLPIFLKRHGWSEEDVAEVEDAVQARRPDGLREAQPALDATQSPQNGGGREETLDSFAAERST